MGRPKKRKVQLQELEDQTSISTNTTNETSPSSIEKNSPIEIGGDVDANVTQGGFDLTPQLAFDSGVTSVDQHLWGYVRFP
jgi:hypothetical protein